MTYTPGTLTDPVTALNAELAKIKAEFDAVQAQFAALPAPAARPQTASVSTGSVPANSASTRVALTWPTPFADTNYRVGLSIVEPTTGNQTLYFRQIDTKTAAGITVRVGNADTAAARTGTLEAVAVHD